MENNQITPTEKAKKKWKSLTRNEKAGLKVLFIFFIAIFTFLIGTKIGSSLFSAMN